MIVNVTPTRGGQLRRGLDASQHVSPMNIHRN